MPEEFRVNHPETKEPLLAITLPEGTHAYKRERVIEEARQLAGWSIGIENVQGEIIEATDSRAPIHDDPVDIRHRDETLNG